jgi:heptosyltransferase-3
MLLRTIPLPAMTSPQRILIYRLGSLGDTVLALPCFHRIRRAYPEALITVLTNAPVSGKAAALESILASTGLIDAVSPYPVGLRDARQLLALRTRLRGEKFDLAISLAAARGFGASLRDLLFFKACGIPKIVGIPFQRRDLVCVRRSDGVLFESEAERLLRRLRPLLSSGADLDPSDDDLRLTEVERAEADRLLAGVGQAGPFIAASLGTKSPLNDWGNLRWTQLLEALSRTHPELGLVLLGSADEYERSQELLKAWGGPGENLCGKTSPRVSAAVLGKAALFVGHDSGPMHLAAAAGTRCVVIFSARCPPGQWFPLGAGHCLLYPQPFYDPNRLTDLAYQQQALASITVDEVLAAVQTTLAPATTSPRP